ncbi:MAG: type III pantothenate kinase [Chromatiales bacterium]|jgi:type III pantothenate kinase|nr:type III pantothenate kinase [Chromatiales bacterium]
MMILLDAGNSRLKWACLVDGTLQVGAPVPRIGTDLDDVYALSLVWATLPRPERVLVSSVLGTQFACALSTYCMETWALTAEFIVPRREAYGMVNAYAEPARLGVDRWLALIGARGDSAIGSLCVVDCGTAITIDAVRIDGLHLGGLIMPGLGLMRRMLIASTQGIRVEAGDMVETLLPWASDTREALRAGTLCAAVAGIDRAVAVLRASLGGEMRCYITGGDAGCLLPLLQVRYSHRPELVLEGLALSAEREQG